MNNLQQKWPDKGPAAESRSLTNCGNISLKDVLAHPEKAGGSPENEWLADINVISELRSLYADIIQQPLPEHLGQLASCLRKADNRE